MKSSCLEIDNVGNLIQGWPYLSVNSHSGREYYVYELKFIQDLRGLHYLILDI